MEPISAAILCGGQSRRMGTDKARLTWNGQDFLDRITESLSPADEILLSVAQPDQFAEKTPPKVVDLFPECGPLSGLYSSLIACKNALLFAVSCDMPLVDFSTVLLLLSHLEERDDAVVPIDGNGRIQPLCALYRKRTAPIFLQQLQRRDYRIRSVFSEFSTKYVPLSPPQDRVFQNLNTPQDYRCFLQQYSKK